jgi:hypothetical protein
VLNWLWNFCVGLSLQEGCSKSNKQCLSRSPFYCSLLSFTRYGATFAPLLLKSSTSFSRKRHMAAVSHVRYKRCTVWEWDGKTYTSDCRGFMVRILLIAVQRMGTKNIKQNLALTSAIGVGHSVGIIPPRTKATELLLLLLLFYCSWSLVSLNISVCQSEVLHSFSSIPTFTWCLKICGIRFYF